MSTLRGLAAAKSLRAKPGGSDGAPRGVRFDSPYGEFTLRPMAALGDKIIDKRIVERNITKGLVSKEQYEQHLAELPDREGSYDRVEVEPGEAHEDSPAE